MTTRLFLIRHGATQLTAEDRFSGDDVSHHAGYPGHKRGGLSKW